MSTILDLNKSTVDMTLKDKMYLVADALRNNGGVNQLYGRLNDKKGGMCAFGLLIFRAGIPHSDSFGCGLGGYREILKLYGISEEESGTKLKFNRNLTKNDLFKVNKYKGEPLSDSSCISSANTQLERNYSTLNFIHHLNDYRIKFDTIADIIDYTASQL